MSPIDSCIWTTGHQLVALFGVMEPCWQKSGLWEFITLLTSSSLCFLGCQGNVSGQLPALATCSHATLVIMDYSPLEPLAKINSFPLKVLPVTVFYHSHREVINIVHHYNHYSQHGLLRKYLHRMSLRRKFEAYRMGWAVAQWYSTSLGCIRPLVHPQIH